MKNILVLLDELFYTVNNIDFYSKFVSINFLKKFADKYKDDFKFLYSFPVYKGIVKNYGSFVSKKQDIIYPVKGWHNIISFYKNYFRNKNSLIQLVENNKNVDFIFIRIPSPAGMVIGKEFEKLGKKVIYNVVGDIKNAYNNYKFPLNIPAFFLSNFLYKKELTLNGTFLTVGNELTQRFKDKNSIFFIDSLIDEKDIKPVNVNFSNPIKILYVGRLLKSKGIYFLIETISDLIKVYPIELIIVGFGKEEQNILKLAKSKKYIKFVGKVSDRNKLNKIYQNSDIFILPTINYPEGFPRVILEAWANGKFVISSKIGGIEGLAKDRENILFFNPGDKEDLIKNIKLLIENKFIRNILKEGIEKIQRKITFEYYAKILYEVLKR